MTNLPAHYTAEQFNELLDGGIVGHDRQQMEDHLSVCSGCRSAFDSLSSIDAALRELPLAETRVDFTGSVMDRILVKKPSPLAFRLLEKLPYIMGLLIVLGIMVASFVVTGVFDKSQLDQTKNIATGFADRAGETLATSIGAFTAWLVQYFPFAFGKGSMGVAFFVAAVVAMLAAVDRLVGKWMLQKER